LVNGFRDGFTIGLSDGFTAGFDTGFGDSSDGTYIVEQNLTFAVVPDLTDRPRKLKSNRLPCKTGLEL